MITDAQKKELISLVINLGKEAETIKKESLDIDWKSDKSPLTKADLYVNERLNLFCMRTEFTKIVSEENASISFNERRGWEYFWLIDPIDGTKEFIQKGNDYTINIALCKSNSPIFSVVYAPARKELYYAEIGKGAFKNDERLNVRTKATNNELKVVASKSHLNYETEEFIKSISKDYQISLVQFGSSLKICKVAEGIADLYPRFGPTMEWDTCASDLVLREAGGYLLDLNSKNLTYNKNDLLNSHFIASSSQHWCK